MAVSPRLSTEFAIVPFDGFLTRLNALSPEAFAEVRALLRKLQKDGPYWPELADKYQTDFHLDTFTCYSSLGFCLEWHAETSPFTDDDSPVPRLRVFVTDLRIVGRQA